MEAIKSFLKKNSECKVRVAVVGDAMVDEYYYVIANRVSPEFPIPVMLSANHGTPTLVVPGGAANVCGQFAHLNAEVNFFGFIDDYGERVMKNNFQGCVKLPEDINIPIKRRLYHKEFPLCRWDIERKNYGWGDAPAGEIAIRQHQDMLFDKFLTSPAFDAIILSDYDKGVFALDGKKRWVKEERPTIVDPKRGPLEQWEGCYIFKPNNKEAKELSGCDKWREQCKYFHHILRCKAVVITQGGDGVVGTIDGRPFEYRPVKRASVESVIGAGDCFISFLAMGVAHHMDLEEVFALAFEAGAIYVQKKHNEPVYPHELLKLIDPIEAKFAMPAEKAVGSVMVGYSSPRNYKLVFTNGCFDILHSGHVALLQHAKSLGDKLVVAVNSDESVRKLKGDCRPVISLKERMRMLAALECVDFVVSFEEETPYNVIKKIRPEVLIKGTDWQGNIVGSDFADEVVTYPLVPNLSTTRIVERIKNEC